MEQTFPQHVDLPLMPWVKVYRKEPSAFIYDEHSRECTMFHFGIYRHSSIWPGRATRPDESKASDSHARSSQIWYENALSHAQSSQIWYENALKTSSQVLGRVEFFEDFLSFDFFFSFARQSSSFFFDHADCGTCFTLAKNGIVIVTRHLASESSDENAHTEVQHLPSAAFLDRFLRSRPGQLQGTFLHGHSSWYASKRKRKKWHRDDDRHAPANEIFWRHTRLRLVTSGLTSFLLVTSASRVTPVWLVLVSFRVFS